MPEFQETRALKIAPLFWKPRPKRNTPDMIMALPPEIQNEIFMLVIPTGESHDFYPRPKAPKEPTLLRVSKQVRKEASCIYFGNNQFDLITTLDDPKFSAWVQRCRDIVSICGPRPFKKLGILLLGKSPIPHLKHLLPLLELMRDLQFEPDKDFVSGDPLKREDKARSIQSGSSLFRWTSYSRVREVLGRAIALGRRARDEQWSEEKLKDRFQDFVKFATSSRSTKSWPATF